MKITAAVLRDPGAPFEIEELELEPPRDDEVLVKMVGAGLCHTDLLSREWPPEMFPGPIVYGHEGSGVVQSVGDRVAGVAVGDHVVLSFDSCGRCPSCTSVGPYACDDFLALNLAPNRVDGSSALTDAAGRPVGSHFFGQSSLASHAVVSARSVVTVDEGFELERLGPRDLGDDTSLISRISTSELAEFVATGAASAGMLPKITACLSAIEGGVGQVHMLDGRIQHSLLLEIFTPEGIGTMITSDAIG
jgi:aryl-alcohol dehydrogenase